MTLVDSGLHPFRVFGVDVQLASAEGVFVPSPEQFHRADDRRFSYGYKYELRLPPSGR